MSLGGGHFQRDLPRALAYDHGGAVGLQTVEAPLVAHAEVAGLLALDRNRDESVGLGEGGLGEAQGEGDLIGMDGLPVDDVGGLGQNSKSANTECILICFIGQKGRKYRIFLINLQQPHPGKGSRAWYCGMRGSG